MLYREETLISVCAQETRWKGESARMLGANGTRYKFFCQSCNKELLVLVCLLLRDGLTVLSMWSESMSGSCM